MEHNELVEIVNCLEIEVFEQTEGVEYLNFELTTNGFYTMINFLGITIWSSENEEREYDEETDSYEPMEVYLRRALNEELDKIRKIKF